MPDIDRLSSQMIDLAERFADVADAAQGKGRRSGSGMRWVLLPAAGAGLYALVTSGSLTRRTKNAVEQAKSLASDLPEDLIGRVRQAPTTSARGSNGGTGQAKTATSASRRRTSSSRRRSSSRKSASSR